jgi:hypothetical protein
MGPGLRCATTRSVLSKTVDGVEVKTRGFGKVAVVKRVFSKPRLGHIMQEKRALGNEIIV